MTQQYDSKLVSELLRRISIAIDKGDYDYLQDLKAVQKRREAPAKSAKATYVGTAYSSKEKSQIPSYPEGGDMYEEKSAGEQFSKFENIEDLKNYITRIYPKKADVLLLARGFSVHSTKSDDYEAIVEKIVDATLGYKLRSRAVRGGGANSEKVASDKLQSEKVRESIADIDKEKPSTES